MAGEYQRWAWYSPTGGVISEIDLDPEPVLDRGRRVVERAIVLDARDVLLVGDVRAPRDGRPPPRAGPERELRIHEVARFERDLRVRPQRRLRFVLVRKV